jgi:hypothetical protein
MFSGIDPHRLFAATQQGVRFQWHSGRELHEWNFLPVKTQGGGNPVDLQPLKRGEKVTEIGAADAAQIRSGRPALFGDFFAGQRLNKAGNSHSFSP